MNQSGSIAAGRSAMVLAFVGAIAIGTCTAQPDRDLMKARSHQMDIAGLAFAPVHLDAKVGDTLIWTNRDVVPHTVTGAAVDWESGEMAMGAEFTIVLDSAGEHAYLCRFHPGMQASVTVQPVGPRPAPGPF